MYRMKNVLEIPKPNPHSDICLNVPTKGNTMPHSNYPEDTQSANILIAIIEAFEQPMYQGKLITDYELIQEIRIIVDNAKTPVPNSIDINTGLRYIEEAV